MIDKASLSAEWLAEKRKPLMQKHSLNGLDFLNWIIRKIKENNYRGCLYSLIVRLAERSLNVSEGIRNIYRRNPE
jgi:hypothetical protein